MYKCLLGDYETSQRVLMLENAELKKVLQQMKKEMIHILSPREHSTRGATADDSQEQVLQHVCRACPNVWLVLFRLKRNIFFHAKVTVFLLLWYRVTQKGRRRLGTRAGKLWTSLVSMPGSSSQTASGSSGGNWGTTWRNWTTKVDVTGSQGLCAYLFIYFLVWHGL